MTYFERLREFFFLLKLLFSRKAEHRSGIFVAGSEEFLKKVFVALDFLAANSDECYCFVKEYIGWILEARLTIMHPGEKPPIFQIGRGWKEESWEAIAGILLRSAYLSGLYHDYKKKMDVKKVPKSAWDSRVARDEASNFAKEKLRSIGVSEEILNLL